MYFLKKNPDTIYKCVISMEQILKKFYGHNHNKLIRFSLVILVELLLYEGNKSIYLI